jgi:hypothetical protein
MSLFPMAKRKCLASYAKKAPAWEHRHRLETDPRAPGTHSSPDTLRDMFRGTTALIGA